MSSLSFPTKILSPKMSPKKWNNYLKCSLYTCLFETINSGRLIRPVDICNRFVCRAQSRTQIHMCYSYWLLHVCVTGIQRYAMNSSCSSLSFDWYWFLDSWIPVNKDKQKKKETKERNIVEYSWQTSQVSRFWPITVSFQFSITVSWRDTKISQ